LAKATDCNQSGGGKKETTQQQPNFHPIVLLRQCTKTWTTKNEIDFWPAAWTGPEGCDCFLG
jgi:hypothetical protein